MTRNEYRKMNLGDPIYKLIYTDIKREKDRLFFRRDFYHGKRFTAFIKNNPYFEYKYDCLIYDKKNKEFIEKRSDMGIKECESLVLFWITEDKSTQHTYNGRFIRRQRMFF